LANEKNNNQDEKLTQDNQTANSSDKSLKEQVMASLNESLDKQKGSQLDNNKMDTETSSTDSSEVEADNTARNIAAQTRTESRQRESQRRKVQRKKENSMVKKIVTIVVLTIAIMLTILGVSFYRYWQAGLKPLNANNDKLVQVNIPIGTSNKGIGSILEKNNVIKSGFVFTYYVKTENITDFKGGYYQMAPNMTLDEIAEMLQQGGTEEPEALADAKITIPEGSTVEEIARIYGKETKTKPEDFLKVVKSDKFFNKLLASYPELLQSAKEGKQVRYRLEGYLFPATYNYYKDKSVEDMVTQMVAKTNNVISNVSEDIKHADLTVQQVLTLASLVEKEGVTDSDRRKIAQVFFNRLETDMPLQSDISILYAMEEHKVHLSNKDTQIDSPYNLYINKGFGPGPFNNPGSDAIEAVVHPAPNDYLYFLADVKTHKVYFAKTYEEHLALKQKYIDSQK